MSSARSTWAASNTPGGFGSATTAFGIGSSQLSYITEPPDLSTISDPNAVVYFRNLSKRDSKTKTKALEDIQAYVTSLQEPVEDSLVEIWIRLYPRTSIDNAKAVRQNAHTAHGQIAASAGKRFARYMSKSAATWLSGLYDSDRSVIDATQASLRQVFNTTEKIQNIRRAYQEPILEYCSNVINRENLATLSDISTASHDDAQVKYSRVVSACIALLGSLVSNLLPEELAKYQNEYDALFNNKTIWNFASNEDASIRRSIHRLLKTCLNKDFTIIGTCLKNLSKTYMSSALKADQIGSNFDCVEALTLLTLHHPKIWTEFHKDTMRAEKRFQKYMRKGSQLGSSNYWSQLIKLIKLLPPEVLPTDLTDASEFLSAFHGGIVRNDEAKMNHIAAYNAYLDAAHLIIQQLPDEDKNGMLHGSIHPIILQYLQQTAKHSHWMIPPTAAADILKKISKLDDMTSIIKDHWHEFIQAIIYDIRTSASKQSRDYETSQTAVLEHVTRFVIFQNIILEEIKLKAVHSILENARSVIISEAISILKTRSGEPYCAAGAVVALLPQSDSPLALTNETKQLIEIFVQEDVTGLLASPSTSYLIEILYSTHNSSGFKQTWTSSLEALLQQKDSPSKSTALLCMLSSSKVLPQFNLFECDHGMQEYIKFRVQEAVESSADWDTFGHVLQSHGRIGVINEETSLWIFNYLTESLLNEDRVQNSLTGILRIIKYNPLLLKNFIKTSKDIKILQVLLLISESSNEKIAYDAMTVNASIQTILAPESDTADTMFDLIQQGLQNASLTSLSIATLVDLAKQLIKAGDTWTKVAKAFPSIESWDALLAPFLDVLPNQSLAITNPLAGAVYLVSSGSSVPGQKLMHIDADGYSTAYRIARYVTSLFQEIESFTINDVPHDIQAIYLRNTALTIQLADDNLSLANSNGLWECYNHDTETDIVTFMSDAQKFIGQNSTWLNSIYPQISTDSLLPIWSADFWLSIDHDSPSSTYYQSRAYSAAVANVLEISGWTTTQTIQLHDTLKTMRRSKARLPLLGFLYAFKKPLEVAKVCERMCNELIAELTAFDLEQKAEEGLIQLVFLNSLLCQDSIVKSIAKQRLVFFVKHVLSWLEHGKTYWRMQAELCRALSVLVPLMSDMYGEHWNDILTLLAKAWLNVQELRENGSSMNRILPFTHASLGLLAKIETLTEAEEPNDDLLEAWEETQQKISHGLLNLLKHTQHIADDFHQPSRMVNDMLTRQISRVSPKNIPSTEDLFPLLCVESKFIQQIAFDILHREILSTREQVSIDAAISKKAACLPEELLSLIVNAPTMAVSAEASFEHGSFLSIRGYLLSWLLIFDHFENASFKIKNDYIEQIKQCDFVSGLLQFMFEFLGHARNKPLDITKFDVTKYEPNTAEPIRDTQQLLTHLYVLSLRHTPLLAKAWFIACKSRAIVVHLEPWTEKFISPSVIAAALESVAVWAEQQAAADTDSPFSIRVAPRAREITASYVVDEQTMSMRISLPSAFPLASVQIEGINRVAVTEQQWQSWLRTSLGAITIFNGSLIDALITFRRNADGTIKGQTECAICYSIVGSDKKLPDKRCQTCKNLFHGGCLFKWFKSGGSSSCPLCRNPFNYG